MTDASRLLEHDSECACGHALNLHQANPAGCLAADAQNQPCACAEFRLADDVPVAVRVQIIQDQLEIARAILNEANQRRLLPEEQFAVAQLAKALVELTDAVRTLLKG